jgi:hypothetical protein
MNFELIPILDTMAELYKKPANMDRFNEYIKLLSGNNNDLEVPIGGYNPMGKEHVLEKINELQSLKAEEIAKDCLSELNSKLSSLKHKNNFKVVLNLSDDLKGGWTNRYTSDYDSKFKLNALVMRNFCTPIFWTGENYDPQKIKNRVLEYCYRNVHWLDHSKPQTLEDHILQENFVAKSLDQKPLIDLDLKSLSEFYNSNKNTENYLTIFNFLYGDKAMEALGNKPLGTVQDFAGFEFAKIQN